MNNSKFWKEYREVDSMLKRAFIQMPGGQGGDPAAGGMPPPGDPAAGGMPPPGDPAAGGMPPPGDPAAGGMPMDPSMMGGAPMDPSMMGGAPMDPSMMGGAPMDPSMMGGAPMDPSMMGGMPPPGDPAAVGAPPAAPGSPMITISLDQLFEIIQKVLGLAKKVGANGSGLQATPAADAAAQGLTQDQLKATIYEALGSMAG